MLKSQQLSEYLGLTNLFLAVWPSPFKSYELLNMDQHPAHQHLYQTMKLHHSMERDLTEGIRAPTPLNLYVRVWREFVWWMGGDLNGTLGVVLPKNLRL